MRLEVGKLMRKTNNSFDLTVNSDLGWLKESTRVPIDLAASEWVHIYNDVSMPLL